MLLPNRIKHAWNAFMNKDPTIFNADLGISSSIKPDRIRLTRGNERSIITSVYNRITVDSAQVAIKHVRIDDNNRFKEEIKSGLNECFNISANIDQSGHDLLADIVMSMLDEGCVAIVPTHTDINPKNSSSFEIEAIRTGKIIEWYPKHVRVRVYNEEKGQKEEIIIEKSKCAIVENPFYSVMNEPNSTMQRLIRKLNLLDIIDEQSGAGKLDMIIQLPYIIKTPARMKQAEERRKNIEMQLAGSKYGIAYIDGTEKVTQLNRPLENNLMGQIEFLTSMLYSQLGLTKEIMDGSANEDTMNNYYTRTIEPILSAIVDEMKRKFLTKTARSQGQSIMFFRDYFKLIPVSKISEMADKFTRNEIMTSNEIRQVIGMKPSSDPAADELRNKNLSQAKEDLEETEAQNVQAEENQEMSEGSEQEEEMASDEQIAELESEAAALGIDLQTLMSMSEEELAELISQKGV